MLNYFNFLCTEIVLCVATCEGFIVTRLIMSAVASCAPTLIGFSTT